MEFPELDAIRRVYANGENVTDYLKTKLNLDENTLEVIEMAYDLQAGSYINFLNTNFEQVESFTSEFCDLLSPHLLPEDRLLDIGTGEMTTIGLIVNKLRVPIREVLAFDISWSRIDLGVKFWEERVISPVGLVPFVADIKGIPLPSKSVDVVTSSGALEPNRENLPELLQEIFRVVKRACVFFEPSWESNSALGKARMDRLGYIKNLPGTVEELGGTVKSFCLIKNQVNDLNPTGCYVITPPKMSVPKTNIVEKFTVPKTDFALESNDNFFTSFDTGLAFPILKGIPILRRDKAILATGICK